MLWLNLILFWYWWLVDGGYGKWGAWQPCNGNCAGNSAFKRTRSCTSPTPKLEGANCNPVTDTQETSLSKQFLQLTVFLTVNSAKNANVSVKLINSLSKICNRTKTVLKSTSGHKKYKIEVMVIALSYFKNYLRTNAKTLKYI